MMMIKTLILIIIMIIIIIIIIIMNIIKTYVSDCPFLLLYVKLSRGPPQNFTDHMFYMTGIPSFLFLEKQNNFNECKKKKNKIFVGCILLGICVFSLGHT